MTVAIDRTSIEEAGTTTTPKREEPVWNVQFELMYQGTSNFSLQLHLKVIGPAGVAQAEQAAYEELRIFLQQALTTATNQGGQLR